MQLLFGLTLFFSAALLFTVQPMFAKMVLPRLGGTPNVWNTCMVFYQTVLLLGYLYAHLSLKWLGPRRQALLHLALLLLPWLVLPIALPSGWAPPTDANPIPAMLLLLSLAVGLPFFMVSASAPLLQTWFSQTADRGAKDPYFLYAASNVGSLLGLFGYPLVIERWLSLAGQARLWMLGFGGLSALTLACCVALWRSRPIAVDPQIPPAPAADEPPPSVGLRLRWLLLSLAPSSLLLGVTTHITTDIMSVPLLWVIPLGLYLVSFVLVFARRPPLPHRVMLRIQPFFVLTLAAWFFLSSSRINWLILPLHLATFFVIAMVCHGELVARRPAARYLTNFYLWMSFGGMLGGLFNAIVAPMVFTYVVEYPVMIVVACLLRPKSEQPASAVTPWIDVAAPLGLLATMSAAVAVMSWMRTGGSLLSALGTVWVSNNLSMFQGGLMLAVGAMAVLAYLGRPLRFGLGVAVVMFIGSVLIPEWGVLRYAHRGYYGLIRVKLQPSDDAMVLVHGSINHGSQSLLPELRNVPRTYYHRSGPLGQTIQAQVTAGTLKHIGVIGLGTGTIAAYGQPGQSITFYEIDPAVAQVASDPQFFSYLADSQAQTRIVLGDARLTLADAPPGTYDLLVLDAYSSDAIPLHLITREALQLYLDKLAPHGIMALHVSNRYVKLEPVVARLADDLQLVALAQNDSDTGGDEETRQQYKREGKSDSNWVVVARTKEDLLGLDADPRWTPPEQLAGAPLWTDDFSNIIGVLTFTDELSSTWSRIRSSIADRFRRGETPPAE